MLYIIIKVTTVIPLKKNYSYLVLNEQGLINNPAHEKTAFGAYYFDTRVLSSYHWELDGFSLLHHEAIGSSVIKQHLSLFEKHKQSLLIVRTLQVQENGFVETLEIINDDIETHEFQANLSLESDFNDMFEMRGRQDDDINREIIININKDQYDASYVAEDNISTAVKVKLSGFNFNETLVIKEKTRTTLVVTVEFETNNHINGPEIGLPTAWLGSHDISDPHGVYRQAELDLHDLLLSHKDGLTIAAGIPWFVTPFGRDSLITAWFLLQKSPELAKGCLEFLAKNQGSIVDAFRDEQPGKILHEQRYAELSRLGILPFQTYYGTADATPLFIMLLADYVKSTGDVSLVHELKQHWIAALNWLETYQDKRGLIQFTGNEAGLTVQSWKDSHDSLSYSDGRLGEGGLAVAEVQGYAYSAYEAAAQFYHLLEDVEQADEYRKKALTLKNTFNELYWMEEHSNYAIAVDAESKKLDINSSDSGHLLWTGIVADCKINKLVERLFQEDMWSGWGLRTLSTQEARYNPISYHNGSVWPHDTAIFAAGLNRYGFSEEFSIVGEAMIDLAASQKDKRVPELFSGYTRGDYPVLPYIEACRPQAWSAAALVYLMNNIS